MNRLAVLSAGASTDGLHHGAGQFATSAQELLFLYTLSNGPQLGLLMVYYAHRVFFSTKNLYLASKMLLVDVESNNDEEIGRERLILGLD